MSGGETAVVAEKEEDEVGDEVVLGAWMTRWCWVQRWRKNEVVVGARGEEGDDPDAMYVSSTLWCACHTR